MAAFTQENSQAQNCVQNKFHFPFHSLFSLLCASNSSPTMTKRLFYVLSCFSVFYLSSSSISSCIVCTMKFNSPERQFSSISVEKSRHRSFGKFKFSKCESLQREKFFIQESRLYFSIFLSQVLLRKKKQRLNAHCIRVSKLVVFTKAHPEVDIGSVFT